jgi:hypothetical protein
VALTRYVYSGVNPRGLGVVTTQILKWGGGVVEVGWGVVEGVVSGLSRSKGEGREPRTPQFSNQFDATVCICRAIRVVIITTNEFQVAVAAAGGRLLSHICRRMRMSTVTQTREIVKMESVCNTDRTRKSVGSVLGLGLKFSRRFGWARLGWP